jgi:hypothetical protein
MNFVAQTAKKCLVNQILGWKLVEKITNTSNGNSNLRPVCKFRKSIRFSMEQSTDSTDLAV